MATPPTCQQIITIFDFESPVLTCPPTDTAVCDISEIPPYATLADFLAAGGTATDSCGINDTTFTLLFETITGTCPQVVTRQYFVTDFCGNSGGLCTQTIIVLDTIAPMISCPGELSAQCDISEVPAYAVLDSFLAAGGTVDDNCGIDSTQLLTRE